jgi:hypothetical protein
MIMRNDYEADRPLQERPRLAPVRHDERQGGDFYLATNGDLTWPPVGTFPWPRTPRKDPQSQGSRRAINLSRSPSGGSFASILA